jgi:isopenicillin N synthase-like dioxygenase
MAPTKDELFASFPSDVPTAPLVTISLKKLVSGDKQEKDRLFEASKSLGFFYLDLREYVDGEALLGGLDEMFDLNEKFYQLPLKEKIKYDFAAKGMYFGYKGMGAEVIDGKGTKDKNEIYNVRFTHGVFGIC